MSGLTTSVRLRSGLVGRRAASLWAGVSAVSIKELRGRMRGRRAFIVLTVYLMLLSIFAFAIYAYLRQQAALTPFGGNFGGGMETDFRGFGRPGIWFPGLTTTGAALSAQIGHGIFGGLLALETLLVLVLAPAFTSGAISLEREKQTLDLLVTTPLSTIGMVVGKLFSALTYVFLLIIASIPLASLVFVFGAVGPEDLVRGYVMLFALAFGMGALGLFVSALVKRTQTATVITFVLVLVLSLGTGVLHQFWSVVAKSPSSSVLAAQRARAPEALLWLNPFVADLDLICATAPDAYHESCAYISSVTGRPYFASPNEQVVPFGVDDGGAVLQIQPAITCPANARCGFVVGGGANADASQAISQFGFPRDTFWPKSAAAFTGLGLLLTLLAAQLVAPTRRWHLLPARVAWPRRRSRPLVQEIDPGTLATEPVSAVVHARRQRNDVEGEA